MRIRALFLLLCLAPAVMAEGLPDLGEAAQIDFSPQMEKRAGESIMREIRQTEPSFMDDPEITGYLNRLGARLVEHSTEVNQDFTFFLLRDSTLNAFAMPGGYIGVHSGLILAAQSESELAGVLAHEISHVTQHHLARQIGKQSQAQVSMLVALAVAIMASRGHSDLAQGALVTGQAAGIQQQLNYSRDFEREADRMGLQLLERAGFDVRGMGSFFVRLQKVTRLYENNAPGYLRTHPLTTERIADMENRIQQQPYRQVVDSLDFQLVRAKLRAYEGTPQDAITDFESQLRERKFSNEAAARYGYTQALARSKQYAAAEHELLALRKIKAQPALNSPLLESLAAELRNQQNDTLGALKILRPALVRYPNERNLAYMLVETLLNARQPQEALKLTQDDLQNFPADARMHALQAKTYAALGKRLQQHRAQAEAYAQQGELIPAIEQLQFAQKASDGDFYEHSQVDARLRELKLKQEEEAKLKKP